MKAFIFAGGLGTRLRPYTYETPKPLLPLLGKPMIEYLISYVSRVGITDITINTFHLAEQFEYLPELAKNYGVTLSISRQPALFEQAGDLAYAEDFLHSLRDDEVFFAMNADTIFSMPENIFMRLTDDVDYECPLLVVGAKTNIEPLGYAGNRLIMHKEFLYKESFAQLSGIERGDYFGVLAIHASVRTFLKEKGIVDSLFPKDGLIHRLISADKQVLYEIPGTFERIEIGTVEDYDSYRSNDEIIKLLNTL